MTCALWFHPTRRGDHWNTPLLSLLSGCPPIMAPAWRARPDGDPPVCVDGALRQLHWEHIWDAWEAEAGLAHSSSEQAQEQARIAAITPRGRPFWRVGQPLDSERRRGGTVAPAPSSDGGWAAQQAVVLALVRSQAERWFALLRDENAALRDENAALKADIHAAQAAPPVASMLPQPLASPALRLQAATRNAAPPVKRLLAPAEQAQASEDMGRRRSSEGAVMAPTSQPPSFAAQLFASIGQHSPRLAGTEEDDDASAASCEEESGDGDGDGDSTGRSHSPAAALAVRAQQRSDMHTCRVAAATCASSMAALTELLQLRWGTPEEEHDGATLAAPPCAAAAPSVASSTAGAAGSVVGGKGCASDDEGYVESASLCGSDIDGDMSLSPRSSASLRSASLAHLAFLRDGAAAAAAAAAASLRSSSLQGVVHVPPSLPANANAAGEAAQAAVRVLAEALHKAQGDADIQHWASAAAACATGGPSVCAPALAVPMWQMMALSSAADTPTAGGHGGQRESAVAPVLAYPSDYWLTSTCVDAHLRTMAPPMEPPIALVACDIRREDSAEFQSVDGGLTADEYDDVDDDPDASALGDCARSVSAADAAAAHDEAAAAVAAALARVSTLPSPLELAAACAREADV
jgi:hypothetical protein